MLGETRIKGGLAISGTIRRFARIVMAKSTGNPPVLGPKKRNKKLLHGFGGLVSCFTGFRATEAELAKRPVDNRREFDKFRALKTRI